MPHLWPSPWRWNRFPPSTWPNSQRPRSISDAIVPVRVMGTTPDDSEAAVYGADSRVNVAIPGPANKAAAIFRCNGVNCELLSVFVMTRTSATGAHDQTCLWDVTTGPRTWVGLDVSASNEDRAGLYGAESSSVGTIQAGESSAIPVNAERVYLQPYVYGYGLPVSPHMPITLGADQELIIWQDDIGAGGAQISDISVYWRERRA